MRAVLKTALSDPTSKTYFLVSDILAAVTVVSIVSIVLETVPSLSAYHMWFLIIEWTAVVIFSLEYIGRIMITQPTRTYIFSFYGLIDLISILPSFVGMANLTFLKSARAVRLIRLLRMVRLMKLQKLKAQDLDQTLGVLWINVLIYLTALLLALLAMGTLIYLVEGDVQATQSIPHGMFWALKVFVTEVPVYEPTSTLGHVVHITTMFVGLVLFGLLIGVASNILDKVLLRGKRDSL